MPDPELVQRCYEILKFQRDTASQPPNKNNDTVAAGLRSELARVFDAGKVFWMVDVEGYGRYYDRAQIKLEVSLQQA